MSTLKNVVSRAGRNRAFPRRLPPQLGGVRFLASTEGGLKYLRRDIATVDPVLTKFAADYIEPDNVVWDIGANVGLFTFAAAGLAGAQGRVLALEPDLWLAGLLRRSAERAGSLAAPVDVVPAAVSSRPGVAGFFIANQSRACNALDGYGNTTTGGVRERQYVPTVSADSLLDYFAPPNVVKVDVEHAEVDLLRGAHRLLSEVRPILSLEVSPDNSAEVTDILVGHRYRMIDGTTENDIEVASWTTVAVPV